MSILWPYIKLLIGYRLLMFVGLGLSVFAVVVNVGLMAVSGWFISTTALLACTPSLAYSFNFFTPGAIIRSMAISRTILRYFEKLLNHDNTLRLLSELRVALYLSIEPLSPGSLLHFRRSDLLHRLVADVDALNHLYIRLLIPFMAALCMSILVACWLAIVSIKVLLLWLLLALLFLVIAPFFFFDRGESSGRAIGEALSQLRINCHDYVEGQLELRVFGGNRDYRMRVERNEACLIVAQRIQSTLSGMGVLFYVIFLGCSFCLLLWVLLSHEMLLLTMGANYLAPSAIQVFFIFMGLALFEIFQPIPEAFIELGRVCLSAERLKAVHDTEPVVTFPDMEVGVKSIKTINGTMIAFQDVTFGFKHQQIPSLNEVNMVVKKGERVVITGKTGCGKSTLFHLLMRDYDPNQGSIELIEQSITTYTERNLRNLIAFMPQRTHIFTTTLRDNLKIANSTLSDERLLEVLTQVGLDSLCRLKGTVKLSLDQWLGIEGRQLSGGERQRIGLARVLLKQTSSIVLLDEPTEALDIKTEKMLVNSLEVLLKEKTVLMVSHRKEPLRLASQIYYMERGRIMT